MTAGADDLKAERAPRPQHTIQRRINRELRHGADSLRRHGGGGDEGFEHRAVVQGGKRLRAESLDVKRDRRAHIRQRLLVGVALSGDDTARQPKRIRDVAVGMFLNDDFERCCHVGRIDSGSVRAGVGDDVFHESEVGL